MKKILFTLLILNLLSGFFCFDEASAITVRIDQPKIRLAIAQGATKSGIINIENPSEEVITVKVYLEDWQYASSADGSKEFFPPDSLPLSCARWITFAPAEFNIAPFGKQAVNYTVNCPDDARGGHYAVMFFETALGEATDETGVSVLVLGRLGSLFSVQPEGTIKKEARLDNLRISKNEGIDITLDFLNTGNTDIAPEGTFYVMDKKGIIAARGEFNKSYTLAQGRAQLSSSISQERAAQIPAGIYDLVITIDLDGAAEVLEASLKIDPSGEISYSYP